jgi:hypothetical protein
MNTSIIFQSVKWYTADASLKPSLILPHLHLLMGLARLGQVMQMPQAAVYNRWQNECFKCKKFDFLHSTNFKILREIQK